MVKNPPAIAGDTRDEGLISGSGRSAGERNGNWLQHSCLGNPIERGAWWTVHCVAKSQTLLSDWAQRRAPLNKWSQRAPSSPLSHEDIVKRLLQDPGGRSSPHSTAAVALILGFRKSPQLWEISFCCVLIAYSVVILLQQSKWTKTVVFLYMVQIFSPTLLFSFTLSVTFI